MFSLCLPNPYTKTPTPSPTPTLMRNIIIYINLKKTIKLKKIQAHINKIFIYIS